MLCLLYAHLCPNACSRSPPLLPMWASSKLLELRDCAHQINMPEEQRAAAVALQPELIEHLLALLALLDALLVVFPQVPDGLPAAPTTDRNHHRRSPSPVRFLCLCPLLAVRSGLA